MEYQKGCDNTVVEVGVPLCVCVCHAWDRCTSPTQVKPTTCLDPDMVRSILDGVTLGAVHQAEVHNPTLVKGDHGLEQEVYVTTGHMLVQMHITDWTEAQKEDPVLSAVLDWLEVQKKTDLKALLAEHASSKEGRLILQNQQNFTIHQTALYLCSMPKG